jgi:Protein of unknown function (DUF5818)
VDHERGDHYRASDDPGQLNRMKVLLFGVLAAVLAAGQGKRPFTGVITDSMCENGDHSRMKMGSNDAECTIACVNAHGASYVLWDGKNSYTLSDQKTPEKFAGMRVTVTGTLNAKTNVIQVDSIAPAK